MSLHRKRISLNALAADAVRSVNPLASKKRILVQLDIPEDMPPVNVDPNLMRRVFQNLLDNSVKSMSEGRIVRVQAGFERAEGALVASIVDLGGGETLDETLFEKYHPGSGDLNENELSLAFCRLVVQAHGGRIWVDERYKNGTKISLTIPEFGPN